MNKFIGIGRLTRDPEVSVSQSGTKVARYSLALDRGKDSSGENKADFINCITFNNTAEFVERYLSKGMKIAIEGRIRTGSYQDKEGRTIYTTDIVIDRHEFCDYKATESGKQSKNSVTNNNQQYNDFRTIDNTDGDLPF